MAAPDFHFDCLILDGHADTPQRFVDESWKFSDPLGPGRMNLESARAGGLSAEFFAIWPSLGHGEGGTRFVRCN